jgi:CheY-like chemotaxis protein
VLVFISYRRHDVPFVALALNYALRLAGHSVFLDTGTVEDGAVYRSVIRSELERSSLLLALVGPDFRPDRLTDPLDVVAFEWRQARFVGCPVHPVLVGEAAMIQESSLPSDLRWFCKRSASTIAGPRLGQAIDQLVASVPGIASEPHGPARVLWVDDNPANNEGERGYLRQYGLVFDNVVSTREAIEQLHNTTYDLVISDLGRAWSSDRSQSAGFTLLKERVVAETGPPLIIYAGLQAVHQTEALLRSGAFGVSRDREDLYRLVFAALGRDPRTEPGQQ